MSIQELITALRAEIKESAKIENLICQNQDLADLDLFDYEIVLLISQQNNIN